MSGIRVRCAHRSVGRVQRALTETGWGRLAVVEPVAQHVDDEGYVLDRAQPDAEAEVFAWPDPAHEGLPPPATVLGFACEPIADMSEDGGWKDHHRAWIPVTARLGIAAPWATPPDDHLAIRLEPGAGFGTGEHATTRRCLAWLEENTPRDGRVLDLGSGSGVLALAALLFGASHTVAVDLDASFPLRLSHHASLNGLDPARLTAVLGDAFAPACRRHLDERAPYDLVVCNIGAKEAERTIRAATRWLAPEGSLLLSGIFVRARARVRSTAEAAGLRIVSDSIDGRWCTLALRGSSPEFVRRGH